jgi:hypothetical protein
MPHGQLAVRIRWAVTAALQLFALGMGQHIGADPRERVEATMILQCS